MSLNNCNSNKLLGRITGVYDFHDKWGNYYIIAVDCISREMKEGLNKKFKLSKNQNWRMLDLLNRSGDIGRERFQRRLKKVFDTIDECSCGFIVWPLYKKRNIISPITGQRKLIDYYKRKGFLHTYKAANGKKYLVRLPKNEKEK